MFSQTDLEREKQIKEAQRLASENDGHVTLRRINKTVVNNDKKEPSKTSAFQVKGHDAVLKAAQDRSAQVKFTLTNGESIIGRIIARDRYTISVICLGDTSATIIYKHFIGKFKTIGEVTNG